MTALLKLIPLQSILQWVLALLRGVTVEQWQLALTLVLSAAKSFKESADKKEWVDSQLQAAFPALGVGGRELLRAIVVTYAQKKGLIK